MIAEEVVIELARHDEYIDYSLGRFRSSCYACLNFHVMSDGKFKCKREGYEQQHIVPGYGCSNPTRRLFHVQPF